MTLEDIVEDILQSKIMDETDSPKAKMERQHCTDQIGFSDKGAWFVAHAAVHVPQCLRPALIATRCWCSLVVSFCSCPEYSNEDALLLAECKTTFGTAL